MSDRDKDTKSEAKSKTVESRPHRTERDPTNPLHARTGIVTTTDARALNELASSLVEIIPGEAENNAEKENQALREVNEQATDPKNIRRKGDRREQPPRDAREGTRMWADTAGNDAVVFDR